MRPGLFFCEMIKMDALIRNDYHTFRLLDYDKSMHPIGAQLCGSRLEFAAPCARMIEELGFDLIDFNCGCPVDKVTKDGSGSGMLKTPQLIGEMIHALRSAVALPVTVKIRVGWDERSINAVEILKIAEQAGAKVIFIHGRTREQGYRGPANWEYIKECKAAAKEIQVFGNGDIVSPESAAKIFQDTGCDGILLSRGTMGKPWLAEEIKGAKDPTFNYRDFHLALKEHLTMAYAYESPQKAFKDARRFSSYYLNHLTGTQALKEVMTKSESLEEMLGAVDHFFDGKS